MTNNKTFNANTDSLQQLRYRSMWIMSWAMAPSLLPFAIFSFIQGRILVGLIVLLLCSIALLNAYSITKHHRVWVPFWCFFIFILLGIFLGIPMVGSQTLFWCYPFILLVSFIEKRLRARILSALIFIMLVPTAFYYLEFELVVRFTYTLLVLFFFSDLLVGEFMKLQDNMTELANHDPLTNAYNRRCMDKCIEDVIEESKRGFGPASLIVLDLDYFKKINDTLGHKAGDEMLVNLIKLIHLRQRKLDYVFRLGGEEFVILLRNTSAQQASHKAESLRKELEDNPLLEGKTVTASFGVAEYIIGESEDDWFKRADGYLYEAKKLGRNCVHPKMDNPPGNIN